MNENNMHLLSVFGGVELITVFKTAKSALRQIAAALEKEEPEAARGGWQLIGKLIAHDNVINPDGMYVLVEIGELVEEEENDG